MPDSLRVLLVDFQASGHHVEYAGRLHSELEQIGLEVMMLTVAPGGRYKEFFDSEQIEYLYRGREELESIQHRDRVRFRRLNLRKVPNHVDETYDAVHFLHADDIIDACYSELSEWDSPPVVATLNGAFFRGRSFADEPLTLFSDRVFHPQLADYLPVRNNRSTIHRCIRDGVFDHLFVPTDGAANELSRYLPEARRSAMMTIPDPVEDWFEELPATPVAREKLDIVESGTVLLFFGQMRKEKGVDLLLEALEQYEGPEFTLVLAGSPRDLTESALRGVDNELVTIHARAEFVPEAEIPLYFAAADGMVLPYRRSFGANRPSGVFQKACASRLPILGPDFGFIQDRINRYGLGETFDVGRVESLATVLAQFVSDELPSFDTSRFREYVATQSFEQLAEKTAAVYWKLGD